MITSCSRKPSWGRLDGVDRLRACGRARRGAAAILTLFALGPGVLAQCPIRGRDLAPPAPIPEAQFGTAVALAAGEAFIGAPGALYPTAPAPGRVWVYEETRGGWAPAGALQASDAVARDYFGGALAVSGDTLAVGAAPYTFGVLTAAVYVFERSSSAPSGWVETSKLSPTGDLLSAFGGALALEGDRLLIGDRARNAAWIFERDPGTSAWHSVARLGHGDLYEYALFGQSVALSGDLAAVGAPWDSESVPFAGAVYVYRRNSQTDWQLEQRIEHAAPTMWHSLGWSTALQADDLIAGAPFGSPGAPGLALVFHREDTGWVQRGELKPPTPFGAFGWSARLDGRVAVIGEPGFSLEGYSIGPGRAWLFRRQGEDSWGHAVELPPATSGNSVMGWSVALDGDRVLVGDRLDGGAAPEAGIARAFPTAPDQAWTPYCSPSPSTPLGCEARLCAAGAPSASASSGFVVSCYGIRIKRNARVFFGTSGRTATPWLQTSAVLCVRPPLIRAGAVATQGSTGPCSGTFQIDLNAVWSSNPAKNPGAGAVVQLQAWFRDELNGPGTLSDALEIVVGL